jgi:tetratricopeptide (TPR) repeat protein
MIGLVQVGGQALADRYTYIPLIGLSLVVAWTGLSAARRQRSLTLPIWILGLAVLALLTTAAHSQVSTWRDNETLFRHALAVTTRNWMAHDMVGRALLLQRRTPEALTHFEAALGIAPNLPGLRNRLGVAYWGMGRLGDAAAQFRESLRLDPSFVPARHNLGLLAVDLREWVVAREQYRVLKTLGAPEADRLLQRIPPAERTH